MIRILTSGIGGETAFKVEGRAVGASGEELTRFISETLATQRLISLDLDSLLSIDQATLEFLARCRERVHIQRAPRYLDRWLDGLRGEVEVRDLGGELPERRVP